MMNKVYDSAQRVPVDAPAGGSISGKAYKVGTLFGVAVSSVPFGKQFTLDREGVWRFKTEAQGVAITPGMKIYFEADRADAEFHNDDADAGSFLIGTALEAVPAGEVKDILVAVEPCHNDAVA